MVFIDYKQAYDSINREELWKAMKYVDMVKLCNAKTNNNMLSKISWRAIIRIRN